MNVAINQPVGFSELGQRANNEDSMYPPLGNATVNDRLFLVCDGVGGQQKGEIASELACRTLADFFQNHPVGVSDEAYLQSALERTYQAFREQEMVYPDTEGMATTLTLLHFHEAGATLAHLGDSRIYQIRNGKILRMTEDHKLVNELVKEGSLTPEEALNHSQRNVITRVIAADRSDAADVQIINDVQAGDYFFLCTDGVLEQLYDDLLAYHLRETSDDTLDDDQRLENIRQECLDKTRDNFTAYLVKVEKVMGSLLPGHTVSLPEMISRNELPVAQPIEYVDFRQNYESDSPTQFTSQVATVSHQPVRSKVTNKRQNNFRLRKAVPLILGVVFGCILTGIAWMWSQPQSPEKAHKEALESEASLSTKPLEKLPARPAAAALPAAQAGNTKKNRTTIKADEADPGTDKEESLLKTENIIADSKKYNFKIIKLGNEYFTIETKVKNKKTRIIYDDTFSQDGVLYLFKYPNGKSYNLYLKKPDKYFKNITSFEDKEDYILCQIGDIRYQINPVSGKEVKIEGMSVDELKKN